MFSWQSVKTIRKHLKAGSRSAARIKGLNRRAISLMPAPQSPKTDVLTYGNASDWNRLALAIESSQQSGCLLIESEKSKSRSAMLVFRGRILSCMYGRKHLGKHLFGERAFASAVADLKIASKKVEIYPLPDNIVIAAASLFHGRILPLKNSEANKGFEEALNCLIRANQPGCIVINNTKESTTRIAYVFGGELIGLHCSKRGWLEPNAKTIGRMLAKGVRIQACMLPFENVVQVLQHTFSPSGLDISNWQPLTPTFPVPQFFFLRRFDDVYLRPMSNIAQAERFFPQRNNNDQGLARRLHRLSSINHAYAICP